MKNKALTTYDIAKYCDVSPRTAVQWISEGKIKAYRTPGNHSRVKIEDFIDFLEKYNIPIPKELQSKNNKGTRRKILIVDDDKNMALSLQRIPELKKDFDVDVAFNGFDAGRKVTEFKPDIVILDIRMPQMDGYEVAKGIKAIDELSQTKIIAISAFFHQDGKEKILSLGADVCLEKPFDREELLAQINALFV